MCALPSPRNIPPTDLCLTLFLLIIQILAQRHLSRIFSLFESKLTYPFIVIYYIFPVVEFITISKWTYLIFNQLVYYLPFSTWVWVPWELSCSVLYSQFLISPWHILDMAEMPSQWVNFRKKKWCIGHILRVHPDHVVVERFFWKVKDQVIGPSSKLHSQHLLN